MRPGEMPGLMIWKHIATSILQDHSNMSQDNEKLIYIQEHRYTTLKKANH
jgi:hypothetical protein